MTLTSSSPGSVKALLDAATHNAGSLRWGDGALTVTDGAPSDGARQYYFLIACFLPWGLPSSSWPPRVSRQRSASCL